MYKRQEQLAHGCYLVVERLGIEPATCRTRVRRVWSIGLLPISSSYVTVMLSKRRYSSDIAVFDMSTVILHNTFKTTTPLVEATVNETL